MATYDARVAVRVGFAENTQRMRAIEQHSLCGVSPSLIQHIRNAAFAREQFVLLDVTDDERSREGGV